jgi:hypothetical protein
MSQLDTLAAPLLPAPPQDKWRREQRAFRQLLPELLKTHSGQYVAIHEGRVVESGSDKLNLAGRAYARFGYVPIYVSLVTAELLPPLRNSCRPRPLSMWRCNAGKPAKNWSICRLNWIRRPTGTVIPGKIVEQLGLVPLDELPVGGFGGQVFLLPTCRLESRLRDLPPVIAEVLAHPEERVILLGRDVLNQHRIVLDGPRLALEIES